MSYEINIEDEKIIAHYPKSKHKSYAWTQRFKESWKELYPWVEPVADDSNHVVCVVCNKRLRCKKDDICKHDKGQKHRLNYQKTPLNDLESITVSSSSIDCSNAETPEVLPCATPNASNVVLLGIDVQPALNCAIEALSHKMATLTAQFPLFTDPSCIENYSGSLQIILDLLTRLKNF